MLAIRFKNLFLIVTFSFLLVSCASLDPIDTSSPQGLYKMGQTLLEQERYEEAITNFTEIKNKHPYNHLATEAELQIANIHFLREAFVEAEGAYKLFKEFHPKHKQIDFVTFRIAMSIYMQLPDSTDQDLAIATDAQMYFKQVYSNYPSSDYAMSAKEHEIKCQLKLARSVYYIAQFYFKQKNYESALGRFNELLENYSHTGLAPKSLYGAAISANKIQKIEDAKKYFDELVKSYPNNHWTRRAKKDLKW